jgi:hypothetical protein
MKKMLSPSKLLLAAFLMAAPAVVRAGGTTPDCGTPATAPIDGGLSLLLGAGAIAYGKKKLAENKKNKAAQAEMEK